MSRGRVGRCERCCRGGGRWGERWSEYKNCLGDGSQVVDAVTRSKNRVSLYLEWLAFGYGAKCQVDQMTSDTNQSNVQLG